jgi:hypothetical protein
MWIEFNTKMPNFITCIMWSHVNLDDWFVGPTIITHTRKVSCYFVDGGSMYDSRVERTTGDASFIAIMLINKIFRNVARIFL